MSLLVRLLTTGKSLVNLKNTASEYRMRHKNPLPKFGSKKNPFAARKGTQPVQAALGAPVQLEPAKRELTPAEAAAANMKETMRLPAVAVVRKPATVSQPVPAKAKVPGWISEWMPKLKQLNPLAWWPKRKPFENPAIPKFNKAPVQGELSLANVKVVRNDLSEADVEIVTARLAAKKQVPPAAKAGVRADQAELAGVQTS